MAPKFTNPHTTPDPNNPDIRRARNLIRERLGYDPLGDAVDFGAEIEAIRARMTEPHWQREAAARREAEEQRVATEARLHYERQLERLSAFHVEAVKAGCDDKLRPLTTTDLQRKVREQWDGRQHMFLLGETAIGKTYTATWCAMRAARRGDTVASITATRVCALSREGLDLLLSADILILDQLHTLRSPAGKDVPAYMAAPVTDLIDWRYEHRATLIAAGTIAPEAMVDLLGADVKRRFELRLTAESGEVSR